MFLLVKWCFLVCVYVQCLDLDIAFSSDTPQKFNSSPLKIGLLPKGRPHLNQASFFRGKLAVQFRGVYSLNISGPLVSWPDHPSVKGDQLGMTGDDLEWLVQEMVWFQFEKIPHFVVFGESSAVFVDICWISSEMITVSLLSTWVRCGFYYTNILMCLLQGWRLICTACRHHLLYSTVNDKMQKNVRSAAEVLTRSNFVVTSIDMEPQAHASVW